MTIKTVEVDDLDSVGAIADQPAYMLPPEAWSLTNNMRVLDGGMRRLLGWSQIFGSGAIVDSPYNIMYVASAAQPWWLWASLTDIFVWDGATHTEISKSHAAYSASGAKDWNGTILGGIPILNNGVQPPQFWNAYTIGTKMADLTNWPASTTARVIRAFGPFLIALNLTTSGANTPHLVRWSTEAVPGSLPSSWALNDPTVDAGQNDLPDIDSGVILDGAGLQGAFYIYKEGSVWRMRFIGGRFIFAFDTLLDTVGLLTTRCVCLTGNGQNHVFVSQDDMVVHNGNTSTPLLEKRFKRYLFNQIDTTNYQASFMFSNPLYDEVWFCYPQLGATIPNRALIWNWKHDRFTEADIDFQCAAVGTTSTLTAGAWSAATSTWAADPNPWATSQRRRTVIGNPTTKKIHLFDDGVLRDGATFIGTLQRTGLGIIGRNRKTGEWLEDFQIRKLLNRLWPKVQLGLVNVRAGFQATPGGAVTWTNPRSFDFSSQRAVDGLLGSGFAIAIEFSAANDWRIDGYKLDIAILGKF